MFLFCIPYSILGFSVAIPFPYSRSIPSFNVFQCGYTLIARMCQNGPEQAWSIFGTHWNNLQVYLRLPGIPWSHIFIPRNPPELRQNRPEQAQNSPELGCSGGSRGSKIWLHGIPGSRKYNCKSFQKVFMMLFAYSELFWPVPGFRVYPIWILS